MSHEKDGRMITLELALELYNLLDSSLLEEEEQLFIKLLLNCCKNNDKETQLVDLCLTQP